MTVDELNGWTPATVTVDADGNVLSVTVTESRFRPGSVDVLLASRRLENSRNEYGIPNSVAMDPANQFKFKAVGPRSDWSVMAVRKAQDAMRKRYPDADMSALRWSVDLKD